MQTCQQTGKASGNATHSSQHKTWRLLSSKLGLPVYMYAPCFTLLKDRYASWRGQSDESTENVGR